MQITINIVKNISTFHRIETKDTFMDDCEVFALTYPIQIVYWQFCTLIMDYGYIRC